jgi:hypothetical protein
VRFRYERLYGYFDVVARIAVGRRRHSQTAGQSAPSTLSITMETERIPTAQQWRTKATVELDRVTVVGRRFSASTSVNEATMLAAADELQLATRDATAWLVANPCPDAKLGTHVAWMLKTCAEIALTAQRAVIDPSSDTEAVMGRLGHLLAVIDFHSEMLDAW